MIVLRTVAACDGDALHAIFSQPGVKRYLFDDEAPTREQTRAIVEVARKDVAWAIVEEASVIGFVALRRKDGTRELVVAIDERLWGRGVGYEAAQAALRHGFEVLKLDRILAGVDLPNERSHRLMLRLGFVAVGEEDGPKYRLRNYEALRRSGT
ncbi:MAG: GNAT family N-acetyltransferase [Enhydrobacter sp.]|nr:MAG: GNAT family N-acetyltransferase [Enhydrobacter sp.]